LYKTRSLYNSPVGAYEDSEDIEGVVLSVLGLGVKDDFFTACRSDQVVNGSLNRLIVLEEPDVPPDQEPSTENFPFGLMQNLMKLHGIKRKLDWDRGAHELFRECKARVLKVPDGMERQLLVRGPEQMIRMATVLACCRFSKVVELSDMEKAKQVIDLSTVTFREGMESALVHKEMTHQELLKEIERRIRTKFGGQASQFEIKNSFRNNKKHKLAVNDALRIWFNPASLLTSRSWIQQEGRSGVFIRSLGSEFGGLQSGKLLCTFLYFKHYPPGRPHPHVIST